MLYSKQGEESSQIIKTVNIQWQISSICEAEATTVTEVNFTTAG